ncbi:MAG: class I SAM-dependent methyltransferase [gamma proteobacterium symbiont of Bathyaustriella thionipta]|nr:class I SAM-dependent methyltransferase [gamma proteobacterium symbiont of Bathyaustriella thionipta]
MADVIKELAEKGIHAWGSDELTTHEKHLTRYFSREYANLPDSKVDKKQWDILLQQIHEATDIFENTERLMDEHYDMPFSMFHAFLDQKFLSYTIGYYAEDPESIRKSDYSLEQAQAQKFKLAVNRSGVQASDKVLDLGCGFGPLETWFSQNFEAMDITALTRSSVQADYLRSHIVNTYSDMTSGKIHVAEMDFNEFADQAIDDEPYDVIFAIGVVEHISDIRSAFSRIASLLKPGWRCFINMIVSKPAFPNFMDSEQTLVGRYFPGGKVWPFEFVPFVAKPDLNLVNKWYLNGMNYWRTLDMWHRNYWNNMSRLYPEVLDTSAVDYWNKYFVYAKAAMFGPLEGQVYGVGHYVFERPAKI